MDWEFVAHHLISGYLPVMTALALYFIMLRAAEKKQTAGRIAAAFVFCFYLVGILTMTGVCFRGDFSPRLSLLPFVDMIRGPVDTILNVLLFVPMGIFLPILYKEFDRVGKVASFALFVSLSVEIAQMFGSGSTDINDLITNTVGACIGYGFYRLLYRVVPRSWRTQIRGKGSQSCYEPLLFWIGCLLIMITIQVPIFHTLFASSMNGGEMQVWK